MAAHRPKIRPSEHAAAAVVTLDPAGVGTSGIAGRLTVGLPSALSATQLTVPGFLFEGWVFEPRMHDDLAVWIADHVGRQRVLLVVENAAYNGAARHLGRAIGCLESILHDLNVAHPKDTQYVSPRYWRSVLGKIEGTGRNVLKQASVDYVERRHRVTAGHDLAEAIAMNDYFLTARSKIWSAGATSA